MRATSSGPAPTPTLDSLASFWPTTETFLTRIDAFAVARFVDVGCGIGDVTCRVGAAGAQALGIDVNAEVVELGHRRAASLGAPASFRVDGTAELGTARPPRPRRGVSRAACSPTSPIPPLRSPAMVAAARPGGLVLVEDVEVAAVWSSPPNDALARHLELYVSAARGLGARPDFACEIAPTLAALGAVDVHVDVVQPVLRTPADLYAHACTMEAIAGPVVDQGLATADEVAALVAQLEEFATTEGVVATLPRVVQVSARAPS